MAKYISNIPVGNDLYKGRSQERLAEFISNYIKDKDENESISPFQRIIGIEGEWGAGKSNVISRLRKILGDSYIFYIHDAWGMQEDLQRRSLLQSLTSFLIQNGYLEGKTTRKNINLDNRKFEQVECYWSERLEFLLGNKSSAITNIKPSIAAPVKWFTLALAITGISMTIGGVITSSNIMLPFSCEYGKLITLICFTVIPLFVWFLYMCCNWKHNWKDFINVYGTSGTTTNSCETISSLEPSVSEFRSWMHDVSNGLPKEKHLIVVFDNMDRLPKEKVRQLWSSIHTFFAENSENEKERYERVWCLIPYDEIHLCQAFEENEDLCKKFLLKTFPITFRVAKPVVSDYKDFCDVYLEEAFGSSEKDLNIINRCYRLVNAEPNPRHIIHFVNELVTLKNAWKDTIPLRYIALFVLNKQNILYPTNYVNKKKIKVTIEQNLLNGEYIKPLDTFFSNSEETLTYISMLVYGVDEVNAQQIPLINYLTDMAHGGNAPNDLQDRLIKNSNFFTILDDLINKSNIENVSNWVSVLSDINCELLDEDLKFNLTNSFENIAQIYIKSETVEEKALGNHLSILIKKCRPSISKSLQLTFLTRYFNTTHKDGHEIYTTIVALKDSWEGNDDKKIEFKEQELQPKQYIDFVDAAKESYSVYPITVNKDELHKFIIGQIASDYDYFYAINILLSDNVVDKSILVDTIRSKIEAKDYMGGQLQRALKLFTMAKSLDTSFYFDSNYLSAELYDASRPFIASNPKLYIETYLLFNGAQPAIEDADLKEVARIAISIHPTAKLCEICMKHKNPVITKLMKLIIEDDMHSGNMEFSWMVKMNWLRLNLNLDAKVILQYISNEGYTKFTQEDDIALIEKIMPDCKAWIHAIGEVEGKSSDLLFNKVFNEISSKEISFFYASNGVPTSNTYWAKTLDFLVKDKRFPAVVPEFMSAMYEIHMQGISAGICTKANETETYKYLRENIKYENISTKWNEVRTKFYNGEYRISAYSFTELHMWFEHTPISLMDAPNFLNKCLLPLIENSEVQLIVLANMNFYSDAMKYIDEASELKRKLMDISKKDPGEFGEYLRSIVFNDNISK